MLFITTVSTYHYTITFKDSFKEKEKQIPNPTRLSFIVIKKKLFELYFFLKLNASKEKPNNRLLFFTQIVMSKNMNDKGSKGTVLHIIYRKFTILTQL